MQQRCADRREFRPWRHELRAQHDLRDAPERSRRREEGLLAPVLPDDMQNGFIIRGIGMMTMGVPISGAQMDLNISDGHFLLGFVIFAKSHNRPGEVRAAAMIPKSGLDNFHRSPVISGEHGLVELLEPKGLHFQFRRRGDRLLS